MAAITETAASSMRQHRNWLPFIQTLLIYGVVASMAILAGVVSSTGKTGLIAIFAGLVAGMAVVSSRKALLWFVILGGLAVVGTTQLYFPGAKYVRYIVPLATSVLLLYALMDRISDHRAKSNAFSSPVVNSLCIFISIAAISTLVNLSFSGTAIMGVKGYFQMWALFFGLVLIRWQQDIIDSLPRGILLIACLQLPFVIHQYLFLVPKREGFGAGVVAADVIAGTFGASLFGGGANAVLSLFMTIVVACLLGIWKYGALSTFKTILMSAALLAPLLVNQAKISTIYIPVIFLVIFYRQVFKSPLKTLGAALSISALLASLLTAYTLSQQSEKVQTWGDLIEITIQRQTADISEREAPFSELSRITALSFWAKEHVSANPAHILIGHGPGASRVQDGGLDLATTLAETRYGGLQIGYTALSAVLWDTGILGLAALLSAFVAAYRAAAWLCQYYRHREDLLKAGLFDGLRAAVVVLSISLGHKDFFAFHIPYQTLTMLIFGYLVISRLRIQQASE